MARFTWGWRARWPLAAALLLALLGAGLSPAGVAAAACNVTNLNNTGANSLRAAVADVNCDPINITISGTITLDAGAGTSELIINRSVIINNTSGGLVTLAGGPGTRRVLELTAGATVSINGGANGLTVSGGDLSNDYGGGIFSRGTLTLTAVTVRNNTINGGVGFGGGIYNDGGSLILINSAVTDNMLPLTAAGGGGIGNTNGTLSLTNSVISGNDAQFGGGIVNISNIVGVAAPFTMTGGSIEGNTAIFFGGGVYNTGTLATATLTGVTVAGNTITGADPLRAGAGLYNNEGTLRMLGGSVVKGNTGAVAGGGIYNYAGTLTVTDSTVGGPLPADANTATNDGGGIYQFAFPAQTASATLTRSAVVGNTAFTGGGIANASYGTATLTLIDTVVNGNFANGGEGGGIINATGSLGTASLVMTGGSISANRTNATLAFAAGCRQGGGLVNRGDGGGAPSATLTGVTIAGNIGTGLANGGAIYNCDGTVALDGVTVSGNTASYTAGILSVNNTSGVTTALTVRRSTISGNSGTVGGSGGIISSASSANSAVTLDLTDSTVSGNTGTNGGSGVVSYAFGDNSTAAATLSNVTIVGNTAQGGSHAAGGFGHYANGVGSAGTATLTNVTVVGNTGVGGAAGGIGGIGPPAALLTTLRNSVLADNSGGNAGLALVSGGRNVSDDTSVAGFFNGPGDLINTDPLLDPAGLQANGGPTRTIALLPGSPAIDRVPSLGANCPAADQRGTARPQGAGCDSGAYERIPVATMLAVTPASGVYGGTVSLVATLTWSGGPVPNQTIAFTRNGSPVGTATTNASGVATLGNVSLGTISAGTYPTGVGAAFAGAGGLASSGTAALTIARATTATAASNATASYGDANVTLTATVANTSPGSTAPVNEGTVTFVVTRGAQTICTVTSGIVSGGNATATCPLGGANAGTATITATYSGGPNFLPSSDTATLTVQRRILYVKPQDRTVGLRQPNPPTTPPAGCLAQATATQACWLELANGSTFAPGQSWSALSLTTLRFQYSRNPPSTNASEYVGKTYRMTAFGVSSANYDIRYLPGTLTVVTAP